MKLPAAARCYLWLVVLAGIATTAWWLVAWRGPAPNGAGGLTLVAFFALLAIAAQHFPVVLAPHYKVNAAIAVYFAALLLFGMPAALLLAWTSHVTGGLTLGLRRHPVPGKRMRTLRSVLFNAAQVAIMVAAGGGVYYGQLPHLAPAPFERIENLWALPATAAAMYLVNGLAVATMVGLQLRRNPAEVWLAGRRHDWLQLAALLLVALAAAVGAPQHPWIPLALALPAALIHLSLSRASRLAEQSIGAVEAMADAVDRRLPHTQGHSRRVAGHAERLARRLNVPPDEVEVIRMAARVLDVGNVAVPERVLLKPGRLTAEEWNVVRRHAAAGWELLGHSPEYRRARELVLAHHERHDGLGYPNGVGGAALPLGASILAVADSFDAMTSDRPYRQALPPAEALGELRRGRGSQWHPDVIAALEELVAPLRDERQEWPVGRGVPAAAG
jgi:HD-GYP domain-containing protein (c-di-GMP phosphodiesterase class II)